MNTSAVQYVYRRATLSIKYRCSLVLFNRHESNELSSSLITVRYAIFLWAITLFFCLPLLTLECYIPRSSSSYARCEVVCCPNSPFGGVFFHCGRMAEKNGNFIIPAVTVFFIPLIYWLFRSGRNCQIKC